MFVHITVAAKVNIFFFTGVICRIWTTEVCSCSLWQIRSVIGISRCYIREEIWCH